MTTTTSSSLDGGSKPPSSDGTLPPTNNANATRGDADEPLSEASAVPNGTSAGFEWKLEYDDKIEKTAADGLVGGWDWNVMRDAIKRRIHQVVTAFMAAQRAESTKDPLLNGDSSLVSSERQLSSPTIAISPSVIEQRPSTQHGLILPPFPKKPGDEKAMPSKLTGKEVNVEMNRVFGMLNDFDDYPPFTIQRVCELLVKPSMYKTVGKYLRAMERTLLVTSTSDQYAADTYTTQPGQPATEAFSDGALKVAMTPLFSPIPFLMPDYDVDARQAARNGSSSGADAAPSPMMLNDDEPPPPSPRLGLVDELDDPSADSNRLADHPKALSATTNVARRVVEMDDVDMDEADLFGSSSMDLGFGAVGSSGLASTTSRPTAASRSGSLTDRFVRSSTPEPEAGRALFERSKDEIVANGIKPSDDADKDKDKDKDKAKAKDNGEDKDKDNDQKGSTSPPNEKMDIDDESEKKSPKPAEPASSSS